MIATHEECVLCVENGQNSEYERRLFEEGTKNGLFWYMSIYSYFQGGAKVYQGKYDQAKELMQNFVSLEEKYELIPIAKPMLAQSFRRTAAGYLKLTSRPMTRCCCLRKEGWNSGTYSPLDGKP